MIRAQSHIVDTGLLTMRSINKEIQTKPQPRQERQYNNLLAAMTSASSKNKMLGAASRALRNVLRSKASPSPTYIEYNSAPLCKTIIKIRIC